jgi:branched-chain amino acid transport system permease protein
MTSQLCAHILLSASQIALVATGFAVLFLVFPRFFHFAHGSIYTLAACVTYGAVEFAKLPMWTAILLGVIMAGIVGVAIELLVYRSLRMNLSGGAGLLIAALGLLVVIQNVTSLFFGDETRRLSAKGAAGGLTILEARLTEVQVITIAVGVVLPIGVWSLLRFSRAGKIMRAVGSSPDLAITFGVPVESAFVTAFFVASSLAAIAGILVGFDTGVSPTMGFRIMLFAVAAVIAGGADSVPGAMLGSLLISCFYHLTAWVLPTQWQDANVFFALVGFLLLRPQGLLGRLTMKTRV